MNLLDVIKRILNFQDWKEASSLPGWRSRPTRMKHTRAPFSSTRKAPTVPNHLRVEEFHDKEERNEAFRALRAKGVRNLNRFSTVRDNKSVWCLVRP